ncbi:hypothetical protein PHYBLDRAFT_171703 [Phycomyces blakesleeanus NRRL 1555(-)]|uniref:Protein arginine methyltransferase NDUFAF7 n=1 Tax=Phycomyces blakesleeanus (strain ATCC 8743b / DSM 1359 / FGSC 10004 / NBRC 33097 / NRRL 1555) TaxID=763407 RepID=A0A167LF77_PHYB8|nr:hypothetical protein PHYBLDRAFT_171703 [Phycomyces blakesleeanus NRRL 1555(-)]OAD70319.1 hypothetical protein PHYBLDRAFT_171703 [Phycomyces blakesleeanus NRRL 1555(-)]|eukprot:XP_018288359.1 hypothetical protein PHYBLDRAFT_171703 [Phycomyces blakesleeanus NRRL 1555(-)]
MIRDTPFCPEGLEKDISPQTGSHNSLVRLDRNVVPRFSKQAVIFSPETDFDFNRMQDHLEFMIELAKLYKEIEGDVDEVDEVARQVWHTPTELFKVCSDNKYTCSKPWYGFAIAKYLVSEYKLNHFPHKDLIIYEMRAERQDVRDAKDHNRCVTVINKSIFDWDVHVPEHCFFLGMEVIDNFAHDLIRYDINTLEPRQALVSTDANGEYTEIYEPVGQDSLISRYLATRKEVGYRSPVLSRKLWNALLKNMPLAPNLTAPEFIPIKLFMLLETLKTHFPQHQLVLSDFSSLPDSIDGVDAPVAQTHYKATMVPCFTYMVQPGWFDIFFPTNFELLRDMYLRVCRGTGAGNDKGVRVLIHREFCERYGDIERTTTRGGENPILMYYENMKMILT